MSLSTFPSSFLTECAGSIETRIFLYGTLYVSPGSDSRSNGCDEWQVTSSIKSCFM